MAVLTADEIEQLRFHLGYGNLQVGAYPWTPDGFFELFTTTIAVWLSDGLETSSTTPIGASGALPAIVTVTPLSMSTVITYGQGSITSAIVPGARLIVDVDDDAEIVVAKSVTGSTFTAKFQQAHDASGYPVAVESGVARLRYLIHRADRVHQQVVGALVTAVAGIVSADKGELVYTGRSGVLKALVDQYSAIVAAISSLIRVGPVEVGSGPATHLESY